MKTRITVSGRHQSGVISLEGIVNVQREDGHDEAFMLEVNIKDSKKLLDQDSWFIVGTVIRDRRNITSEYVSVTVLDFKQTSSTSLISFDMTVDYKVSAEGVVKHLHRLEREARAYWVGGFIHDAYKANVNPLPILRKLIPGMWTFEAGNPLSRVFLDNVKIWEGLAPRLVGPIRESLGELPADDSVVD